MIVRFFNREILFLSVLAFFGFFLCYSFLEKKKFIVFRFVIIILFFLCGINFVGAFEHVRLVSTTAKDQLNLY